MVAIANRFKTLLIQLPHASYSDRNIPLAAGYLKATAFFYNLLQKVDIEILDTVHVDNSGCNKLINTIISKKPYILGFSLYLWNVERSLYIINKIKEKLPSVIIIIGGPEVVKNSHRILSDKNINIAVFGEGEITFIEILNHFIHGNPDLAEIPGIFFRNINNCYITQPRKMISNLEIIPSPYLLGYIEPKKYREMMLFTMRGCMLGCLYCSWSSRGRLRSFSLERLKNELQLAIDIGDEMIISIIDSAFNLSPLFKPFCEIAKKININKHLKFNCFVQADLIDKNSVKLLKESNFISVEVGLQSTNSQVLSNINRNLDIKRFLNGVNLLRNEGIPVKVDVIIGLPGDSMMSFEKTMKFISNNKLDPLLFNLSVGPGSRLKSLTKKFGFSIQEAPPYYVTETNTLNRNEIEIILNRYKDYSADYNKLSNLYYPSILSKSITKDYYQLKQGISFLQKIDYPISSIILKVDKPFTDYNKASKLIEIINHKISNNLTFLYLGNLENLLNSIDLIKYFLSELSNKNPYTVWNIYFETNELCPPQSLINDINYSVHKPKTFLDHRDEIFPKSLGYIRRKSVNIFSLLSNRVVQKDKPINNSNIIRIANILDQGDIQEQINEIFKMSGSGFLLDFPNNSNLSFIKNTMDLIHGKDILNREIFFKDWVLQRLWDQEFKKITPVKQLHYELILDQDMRLFGKYFDEYDLIWDSISNWKLVESHFYNIDIEKYITEKVFSKLQCSISINNS